jgi:hypothetical protein
MALQHQGRDCGCSLTTAPVEFLPEANQNICNSAEIQTQGQKLNMYTEFMMSQLETRTEKPALADDFSAWYASWNWTWKVSLLIGLLIGEFL